MKHKSHLSLLVIILTLTIFTSAGLIIYSFSNKANTEEPEQSESEITSDTVESDSPDTASEPTDTASEPTDAASDDTDSNQNENHSDMVSDSQDGFYYETISDSLKEFMYGYSYKEDCTLSWDDLRVVTVQYYNFDNIVTEGQIVCNKAIAQDLLEIFYELYTNQYQIEEITPIDSYQADDELSMEHNNTSCFNYRTVPGRSTMSKHSLGLAIDINPFYNPYITKDSSGNTSITPVGSEPYADRSTSFLHKITPDDLCYQLFTEHGFTWGGSWKNSKDYQHFQKDI